MNVCVHVHSVACFGFKQKMKNELNIYFCLLVMLAA